MNDLFSKIQSSEIKKYPLLSRCIMDGILYPEVYKHSYLKIAFILKEPYAEWDENTQAPAYCDFDFSDIIHNLKKHYNEGLNKTWLKVSAIAYALKNKIKYTENLSYEQVVEGLSCVAWINLSKTPWKTTTKIDNEYYERINIWKELVKEQLIECSPDIVFYGNTWDFSYLNPIEPNIEWKEEYATNIKQFEYISEKNKKFKVFISNYRNTNKLIINGYHPELGKAAEWQTGFIQEYLKFKPYAQHSEFSQQF